MFSLKKYNTFGLNVKCLNFIELNSEHEAIKAVNNNVFKSDFLILGGGSNVLFTKDFNGTIVKNNLKGINIEKEDENSVYVKAMGGEIWHEFVLHCIKNDWAGVENLSLIPGSVGAAPMQNIGAYGVEIKDIFYNLEAIELESGKKRVFNKEECNFGYRESVFKNIYKDKYFISSVTFKLNKKPNFNTSYGAIEKKLNEMGVEKLSIKAISDAVIAIRTEKLPDPTKIGNAGSFFKNPIIDNIHFQNLKKKFPSIANYPLDEANTKVAAGWLIEQAGWKGKTFNNYGVHKNQALVLVNYGDATGKEIYDLSEDIIKSVQEKFGITLEREVNIV